MTEKNDHNKLIKILVGILAIFKLGLAIFAWLDKDPNSPVTWGELRIVLLIEAIIIGTIAIRLIWFNYALFS